MTTASEPLRIAIIGFGFSGLMVAANLVNLARNPLTIYLIDTAMTGRGTAYATRNPDHLLNVRARGMDAFANRHGGFVEWLQGKEGKALGIAESFGHNDFVPRTIYGAMLDTIWHNTQEIAATKNIQLKCVPTRAVALQEGPPLAVLTERGDAIAADKIILAAGHETKPVLTHMKSAAIIQNVWSDGALAGAEHWPSPTLLIGTGLTAVDMLLSLRRAGYTGEVIATSRNGLLPQSHTASGDGNRSIFKIESAEITAATNLRKMLRLIRQKITEANDWREVIDALRPYTQTWWQRLSLREQKHFLKQLAPYWNIHRHRMAPQIAARVDAEVAAGTLRIFRSSDIKITGEGNNLSIITEGKTQPIHHILNCTGLELNLARSSNNVLRQLIAENKVDAHATGLGVAADPQHRAWGRLYPNLYVIGSLLTGQLLESTAVPELRVQAESIARAILSQD